MPLRAFLSMKQFGPGSGWKLFNNAFLLNFGSQNIFELCRPLKEKTWELSN